MAVGAQTTKAPRTSERRKEAFWGYGFISIWFIGFAVFTAVPLAMSVYISFTSWSPIAGPFWEAKRVGFSNYGTFLHDHRYWHSIFNTLYFSFGSVLVVNVVSIPLAMNSRLEKRHAIWGAIGHVLVRTIALLAIGIMMFNSEYGVDSAKMGWSGTWWTTCSAGRASRSRS